MEIKRNNRDGTAAPALQRFQYQTVKTLIGCDVICPLSVFFHMDAELLFALQISREFKFFAQGKGQRGLGLIQPEYIIMSGASPMTSTGWICRSR